MTTWLSNVAFEQINNPKSQALNIHSIFAPSLVLLSGYESYGTTGRCPRSQRLEIPGAKRPFFVEEPVESVEELWLHSKPGLLQTSISCPGRLRPASATQAMTPEAWPCWFPDWMKIVDVSFKLAMHVVAISEKMNPWSMLKKRSTRLAQA